MKTHCLVVGLLCALPALGNAQSAAPLHLVQTISMPNVKGRIDHMDVDVKVSGFLWRVSRMAHSK